MTTNDRPWRGLARRIPLLRPAVRAARVGGDYARFVRDFVQFAEARKRVHKQRFEFGWQTRWPCLGDWTEKHAFEPHYTYHPAWAARIVRDLAPAEHVDLGSTLHFSTMLSAFVPVRFFDFRATPLQLTCLETARADLCALPFADRSIASLSCMHVVEHVGLGRYGDPLDPEGDLKAMAELQRVVAPGGSLLFVVPVGRAVIQFNGQRVYAYQQVIDAFSELNLREFSLIPDNAHQLGMIRGAAASVVAAQKNGCGCFWFTREAGPESPLAT